MPETTPEKIWRYIYKKREVRARDLEKEFVDTGLLSRGTMYKYKKLLDDEGKIKARSILNARPPYNVYYVPKNFHDKLEAMIQRERINFMLDGLSPKGQIISINLWSEIQMVVQEMIRSGYPLGEIRSIMEASLEELHSRLVDRIVEDEEK